MKKRILAALLAMALVISSFSGIKISADSSLNEKDMERVLLIVKEKLDIPDYDNFQYNFYDYSGRVTWNFEWRNGDDYSDYLNVEADNAGHIRYYSVNKNNVEKGIPAYLSSELEGTAKAWIDQVEPEISKKVELTDSGYSYYSNRYTYTFTRVNAGIRLPENTVSVGINAKTGAVVFYRENWNYEVKLTSPKNLITKEEAAEKIGTKVDMELRYFRSWNDDGKATAFLAYVPTRSYVAANAKTGKIYLRKYYLDGEWDNADEESKEAFTDSSVPAENGAGKRASISEAERKKIDEIKDIITAEDAKQLILDNPYLYKEAADYSIDSYLSEYDGEYYWDITLNDSRPYDYDNPEEDWYRSYIYASINAKTGEINNYSASVKTMWDYKAEELEALKVNFTRKQCRANFEEFAKKYNGERFKETKLSNTSRCLMIGYDEDTDKSDYAGYDFEYIRTHEGIPFNANSISGGVEAFTGKIFSYYSTWDDEIEFPSSKNVIGADKAFESYMSYDGYDLVYELVTVYGKKTSEAETRTRLVYRTDIPYSYVDAKTGKQLNYWGEEYDRKAVNFEYSDIEGSKYERTIRLLADMGVGLEKTEFKPDAKITSEDFETLLKLANNFSSSYYYYPVYADIAEENNAGEETAKSGYVTRSDAAEAFVKAAGYEEMAKMDIYRTGYDDEAEIKNVGAVALAKGLGFMGAKKGNSFKPASSVTNGEAAELIMNFIEKKNVK